MSPAEVLAVEAHLRRFVDDTTAWGVYGDWLCERGNRLGEFAVLASQPGRRDVEVARVLLEGEFESAWAAELPAEVEVVDRRHGFIHHARLFWGPRTGAALATLLAAPSARLLSKLEVRGTATDGAWTELPTLDVAGLLTLDCAYVPLGLAGLQALASADLSSVTELDLRYAELNADAVRALVASPSLGALESLSLAGNELGPHGARALADARWPHLCALDLRHTRLGERGLEALLAAPFLPQLRRLLLSGDELGPSGARALSAAPRLSPPLRALWSAAP